MLIDDMLQFEVSGIPTHYAIIGSRGSGKTLTLKYLQRVIPEQTELEVLYANCRDHNTSFKILAHLLGVRARGRASPSCSWRSARAAIARPWSCWTKST